MVINGPTDNENSSIEYKDTFTMNGGEFIAADYEAESFVKGVEITEITLEDSVYNWTENE